MSPQTLSSRGSAAENHNGIVIAPAVGSREFFRDPHPTYRSLREQGPLVSLRPNVLACTRYDDCLAQLRDPRFSARRYMRPIAHYTDDQRSQLATWVRVASQQVLFTDPPDHTRLRGPLMRAFSPEAIELLIPRIANLFSEILDDVSPGVEFDFMSTVAQRFPAMVIGELLGIQREGWSRLMRWCDAFMDFFATVPAPFRLALEAQQATIELIEYMQPLVERRRSQPAGDLISMLLEARQEGSAVTTEEVLAQCALLLVAGHETTRNLMGNGLHTLLQHPSAITRLRQDSSLGRGAVEEVLRFQGPVQGISRVVATRHKLFEETLEPGQAIIILVASANRDPVQFSDPDRFDIERKNNTHLTFGAGAHTCLGSRLARLEAQIAITMLLRRYKRIELRDANPAWTETLLVRGPKRLDVVCE
jgi:cytochrome P450